MKNKEQSEALETKKPAALAVPAFMQGSTGAGTEQIGREDMTLPRLAIAQSNSPAAKKSSPERIQGLEEGQLYNTLSREIVGEAVELIPILYFPSYIKFAGEGETGVKGIRSNADNIPPAELEFGEAGEKPVWTKLFNFLCLIPSRGEIVIVSMKSTGAKVAKQWNSWLRKSVKTEGGKVWQPDAFSFSYALKTVAEHKDKFDYFNFEVDFEKRKIVDNADTYNACKAIFTDFSGVDLSQRMDTSGLETEAKGSEDVPF